MNRCHCLEKNWIVLYGLEPAGDNPQECVSNTQPGTQRRARRFIGLPILQIDTIEQPGEEFEPSPSLRRDGRRPRSGRRP
jgi:hypothetical protein